MSSLKHIHTFSLILILVISVTFCSKQGENIKNQVDLPLKEDLMYFMVSLQKVIEYFKSVGPTTGQMCIRYGLYFVIVNLKTALLHDVMMPESLELYLVHLIEKIQSELSFIVEDLRRNGLGDNPGQYFDSMIIGEDPKVWVERLIPLDDKPPPPLDIRRTYYPIIYNLTAINATIAAACGMSVLSEIKDVMEEPICTPNKLCYNFLLSEEHYYTQLSERIMLLVLARFARGCSMFSATEDQQLMARHCAIVYNEFNNILYTAHEKDFLGLFIQNLAFCLLAGHREFHRRAIYNNVMKYQQLQGCFALAKPKRKNLLQKNADMLLLRWEYTFSDDAPIVECDPNFSFAAAAALSAGLRFMTNGEIE